MVKIFLIVLISVIGSLALLLLAASLYFFIFAFYRRKPNVNEGEGTIDSRFSTEEALAIKEGIQHIDSLSFEQVYVKSFDGLTLAAKYYPVEQDTNKVMILFHGYRASGRRDYSCAVKMYMDLGYNILLVDERACGLSQGKLITFGAKERYDVISWIDFILERKGKDTKICLGGLSMGAAVVMMASSLGLPENVKCIVADCGYTSPAEIISHVAKTRFHVPGGIAVAILNIFCVLLGRFSLYKPNTLKALRENNIPILFIHGLADNFVPWDMTVRNYAVAKARKRMCLVEGAGHGRAYLTDKKKVTKTLIEFISECEK